MNTADAGVVVSSPGRNYVTLVIETEDGVTGVGDATLTVGSWPSRPIPRSRLPLLIGRDARRSPTPGRISTRGPLAPADQSA